MTLARLNKVPVQARRAGSSRVIVSFWYLRLLGLLAADIFLAERRLTQPLLRFWVRDIPFCLFLFLDRRLSICPCAQSDALLHGLFASFSPLLTFDAPRSSHWIVAEY